MSIRTLRWLRISVPGVMLVACVLPLLMALSDVFESLVTSWVIIPLVLVGQYALGSLYEASGVRHLVAGSAQELFLGFISHELVSAAGGRIVGDEQDVFRAVRASFFEVIDSDASLSALSDRIRSNGLMWSSLVDAMIIFALTAFAWLVVAVAARIDTAWATSGAFLTAAVVSGFVLSPLVARRHVSLIALQLRLMLAEHRARIAEDIRALAETTPGLVET